MDYVRCNFIFNGRAYFTRLFFPDLVETVVLYLETTEIVGSRIAALPTRPVHNTVQVYRSTNTTQVIRLYSLT